MKRDTKGKFVKGEGFWKGKKRTGFRNSGTFKKGDGIGNTHGFKKGNIPWNNGTRKPKVIISKEDTRKKQSIVKINKWKDKEYKEHMKNAHKGQHSSPSTEFKRGTNPREHWNWRGGIAKLNSLIRSLPEIGEWRKNVFERDNFTCKNCGSKKEIEAHHIIKFSKIIEIHKIKSISDALKCELLWEISNGKTLCKKCHRQGSHAGGML